MVGNARLCKCCAVFFLQGIPFRITRASEPGLGPLPPNNRPLLLRSVAAEQQQAFLCSKEPVMRRSAAALLARQPAPSSPQPEGLDAVRAAAAAAMLAVDAKLAAVRASVSGLTDRVAAASAPALPRRSSAPNLPGCTDGDQAAALCPAIERFDPVVQEVSEAGPAGAAERKTRHQLLRTSSSHQSLLLVDGGELGGAEFARAGWKRPAAAAVRADTRGGAAPTAGTVAHPWIAAVPAGGDGRRRWLHSATMGSTWSSTAAAPFPTAAAADECSDGGFSELSPRGPGPMLAGLSSGCR